MMTVNYPKHYKKLNEYLGKLSDKTPKVMEGFSLLHQNAISDGALSGKVKELIALSISIALRCNGCIVFHIHDALEAGASEEEITETIGVAVMMGGSSSVACGCEALEALEQFIASKQQ